MKKSKLYFLNNFFLIFRKESIKSEHLKVIDFRNKYFDTISSSKTIEKLGKFSEADLKETVIRNISYYKLTAADEKDLSKLALGIQYDLSHIDRDFK
jgi:hypothetical protein